MVVDNTNTIFSIPVIQNQQEFMIGVFKIEQILNFTMYTKRLIVGFDESDEPIYNKQIQRDVEQPRAEKIADFLINDPQATFPTNIVLHIPIQAIEEQERLEADNYNIIKIILSNRVFEEIKKEKKSPGTGDVFITIIDGQHRIRGIEIAINRLNIEIESISKTLRTSPNNVSLQEKLNYYTHRLRDLKNIQLVVSFFIDKTLEYQAMIFSTINRTQKRVTESLVYSLFGLTTKDSPHKTALQITLALNGHHQSPFHGRIKLYGWGYSRFQSPPLSQAAMVKSIINLISENARESETDRFRNREELKKRISKTDKSLPFRKYYANDQDTKMSDILYYFFSAVKECFLKEDGTSYWDFQPDRMRPTNILQTTVGYMALLLILDDIIQLTKDENKLFDKNYYKSYLEKANTLNFEDLERYPFTSKTKTIFYLDLSLKLFPNSSSSDPRLHKLEELIKK